MPDMPLAGAEVANEIALVCNEKLCPNFLEWLNELYVFRIQYNIYQQALLPKD